MPLNTELFDALHKNEPAESAQSRYEKAIKAKIKQQASHLAATEDPSKHALEPASLRQSRLEHQISDSLDLAEFNQHLSSAISILVKEAKDYLNHLNCDHLIAELQRINTSISELPLAELNDRTLYQAINMSALGLSLIFDIAIAKCSEGNLPDSLSLFALLATLDSSEPNYWYRLGLVAQKTESYELATRAYAAASSLAPEFVGAPLFASQCWMKRNQREKALTELAKAKTILQTTPSKEWHQYIIDLESLLSRKTHKER